MSSIQLLDCTLRDGGYINHWNFGREVISAICEKLSNAGIDIIEVGFLTDLPRTQDDSLYNECSQIDSVTEGCEATTSQMAAMIAIGEMELDPVCLPSANNTRLQNVRITFHNTDREIDKAFRYARCLMEKGYDVCMQPVGTTAYTDAELIDLIKKVNQLKPFAFYLVDTLGVLHRGELLRFIGLIDKHLEQGIHIGFHSHNNLQMSYANAQCIREYESSREFIVDCSVYGMGRGAGNLCTELIAQYENTLCPKRYEMTPIYDVLDDYIYPIHMRYDWGYNAHYYTAAVHHCHPNYASFLMNKQTLTMNGIDLILKNIPQESRYVYDKKLIETLYYNYQNHSIDDERARIELSEQLLGRNVLLLGSGSSLNTYKEPIDQFIADKKPIVISIQSLFHDYECDYIFVSNLKRLYMLDIERLSIPMILTSNLPHIVNNGIYVDYAALCEQDSIEPDNSGMMLIRLLEKIGLKKVYIAGFDGFVKEVSKNYISPRMINSIDLDKVDKKNVSIARQLQAIMNRLEIVSLTPSLYFEKTI